MKTEKDITNDLRDQWKDESIPMYIGRCVLDAKVMNPIEFIQAIVKLESAIGTIEASTRGKNRVKLDTDRLTSYVNDVLTILRESKDSMLQILSDVHINIDLIKKQQS